MYFSAKCGHTEAMNFRAALPSTLVLGLVLSSCSSSDEPGGSAGAGGASAGSAGQAIAGAGVGGAVAGSGGGSSAGAPTSAGAGGATGGSGGASAGSGGASGGASGGSGGAAGGGFWGPTGPKKQWTCPANPVAATKGTVTNQCQTFAFNYGYNEGPTWIASQSAFFFSNFRQGMQTGGDIIKFTLATGTCEVWLHDVACNGLGVSPSGNLLAACHGPRAIMEYNVTTKEGRTIANMAGGKKLDSVNDLIARSDGNVYASNTTYELDDKGSAGVGFGLIRVDPFGVATVIETGGLNGLALSPDETKLWVVQKGTFNLDAAGVATKGQGPTPGGDGIAVDCAGTIINEGTNAAFGGPDGKTLIAVGGGKSVRTIAMSAPGLP